MSIKDNSIMNEKIDIFTDIIEPRRNSGDTFRFMSRYWNPQQSYKLEKNYSPQDLKDEVATSLYIDAILEAESVRIGVRKENLRKQVLEFLEEIGLDKKVYVIRWLGILILKIFYMMKIGVFVNERTVFQLKSSMGHCPVLFLPTHRSYADFCLMTYLSYHYDIDFPAVAAGMDFYSMAILGRRMRETCAFYIRRTLAGDPLYAATLRHYVRTLVKLHCAPIEFFLEGTRSRSNKSMSPKYGMLSMALMPLFSGEVPDVTIVPVNITYERLMEQKLFAYEHLGIPKPKESTGGFIKALNTLNDFYGNVYVNLGSPFSVKEYFKGDLNQKNTLDPVDLQEMTPEQFALVQNLAHHTVILQQKHTVVTITNLICTILMQSLIKNVVLVYEELLKDIDWLKNVLKQLGASVITDKDVNSDLERIVNIHSAMLSMNNDKLQLVNKSVANDGKNFTNGFSLQDDTMSNSVSVIQLQLYVNPILHYLVPSAIIYLLTCKAVINKEQLSKEYNYLRRLLKYEFFYVETNEDETFQKSLSFLLENQAIKNRHDELFINGNEKLQYLLRWIIWPALVALYKTIEVVTERDNNMIDHKSAQKVIQKQIVESDNTHPYSLSIELIGNCLQGLTSVGALTKNKRNDSMVYTVVKDKMTDVSQLVISVLPTFHVTFDSDNIIMLHQSTSLSKL